MPRRSQSIPPAEASAEDAALAREAILAVDALSPVEWMARYAEPLAAAAARSAAAQAFANEYADRVRSVLQRSIRGLANYRKVTGWTPAAAGTAKDPGGLAGAALAAVLFSEMLLATQPASAAERVRMVRERDRIIAELEGFVATLRAVRGARVPPAPQTFKLPTGGSDGN